MGGYRTLTTLLTLLMWTLVDINVASDWRHNCLCRSPSTVDAIDAFSLFDEVKRARTDAADSSQGLFIHCFMAHSFFSFAFSSSLIFEAR